MFLMIHVIMHVDWSFVCRDGGLVRRFFINSNYGSCEVDSGWMTVADQREPLCSWETGFPQSYPFIVYAAGSAKTRWKYGIVGKTVKIVNF